MKVRDRVTLEQLSVDEAYERFFDGFYNLGRPREIFERTVVLAPPKRDPTLASSQPPSGQALPTNAHG